MLATEPLPLPVPTGIHYYALRSQDYAVRHPGPYAPDREAIGYYLLYGDKYCRRFCLELRRRLSPQGQAWVDRTCRLLQQAIEQKRAGDPRAFAALEEDGAAFRSFAFSTHAAAYIHGGITFLPLSDLVRILHAIDWKDLLNIDGLRQVARVLVYLASPWNLARAIVAGLRIGTDGKQNPDLESPQDDRTALRRLPLWMNRRYAARIRLAHW